MALQFRTSEEINKELGREGSVEDLGTLKKLLPKGSKVKFGKNNFNNDKMRVVVVVTDKNGKLAFISCSKPISLIVRKLAAQGKEKKDILGWLITLHVMENEQGMFISKPMGEAGEDFEIDKLEEQSTEEFVPADLIVW